MVGEAIKMGRTGIVPRIASVVWQGTAEVNMYHNQRTPAALVVTECGADLAVVRLRGNDLEANRWWDARVVSSREWETTDGDLVGDVRPDVARRIDTFLATANRKHDYALADLRWRVQHGSYLLS